MPLALPPLNALWRPNTGSTVDDLERIRTYIGWPGTQGSLTELIMQLNTVADLRPAMVTQVQTWVDEIADLEETQADAVAAGTAHLGNAEEYEGPIPGTSPTRDQQLDPAVPLPLGCGGHAGAGPEAVAGLQQAGVPLQALSLR